MGNRCQCGGDCGPCSQAKAFDDLCDRTSRKIMEIDAEQDEIRSTLAEAEKFHARRKALLGAGGPFVSAAPIESVERSLRERLERLDGERQALLGTLCARCPDSPHCSTNTPNEGYR